MAGRGYSHAHTTAIDATRVARSRKKERIFLSRMGRLVLTHSTHLPGLVWILRKMIEKADTISTVVPARIALTSLHDGFSMANVGAMGTLLIILRPKPSVMRNPHLDNHRRVLDVRVTTPTPTGYKLLARHERMVQEVRTIHSMLQSVPKSHRPRCLLSPKKAQRVFKTSSTL